MEVEFVRGVKMGEDTARNVKNVSGNLNITLSVHAPYYINLNSPDPEKIEASVKRIKQSARIGNILGARNITFHPAFYMRKTKGAVYKRVKKSLEIILKGLRDEGIDVLLRPETTGKRFQFGSLEEVLKLSSEVEGVLPCFDFSHLHARNGRSNSPEEFRAIHSEIENMLGRETLKNMHIHLSGIEYTRKGERNHLNLMESDLKYRALLETWKEFDLKGIVICESPNLEGDALLLKDLYKEL
jgi:deoxyribonuclease-4